MRRTLIALSTSLALTMGGTTAVATAAEPQSSNSQEASSKLEGSSYIKEVHGAAASSDNPQLNNFYAVMLDALIGFAAFAVLGAIYAEVAKRLPM